MSSAESADEDESATADTTRRSYRFQWLDRPWVWPLFGVVAVLVFELTANVGLAVAIFCAKLGLRDVRLGWWLYRQDPDRKRGTITGLIAASMIGLKVTIASLITITALFVLSTVNPLN